MTQDNTARTNKLSRRSLGVAALGVAAAGASGCGIGDRRSGDGGMAATAATATAQADWFSDIRTQHAQLRQQFDRVAAASGHAGRAAAFEQLSLMMNGHSLAEEVALYPGMAQVGLTSDSRDAYREQAAAKVLMAELEAMPDKGGDAFLERLNRLREMSQTHMAEEERDWFPQLAQMSTSDANARMTTTFRREFNRYVA